MEQAKENLADEGQVSEQAEGQAVHNSKYNTLSDAIEAAGYGVHETIPDGRLHRLHVPGDKSGSTNLWYYDNGAHGVFESWKDGERFKWRKGKATEAEIKEAKKLVAARKADYKANRKKYYAEVEKLANESWDVMKKGKGTAYTSRKQIQTHGAKQTMNDTLLVPMFYKDKLVNIQRIFPDGSKYPLQGGRVKGCYSIIGKPLDKAAGIVICEGWATGCSLYEDLVVNSPDISVVVAFTCHQLARVSLYVRKQQPNIGVVIAADNDVETEKKTGKNPGIHYGKKAAEAIDARFMFPDFAPYKFTGSDFNDLLIQGGAINPPASASTSQTFPDIPNGYSCVAGGVFIETDDEDIRLTNQPVYVKAISRDTDDGNWGMLIWWLDRRGREHEQAIPLNLIHAKGTEAALLLIANGLPVVRGQEGALLNYLAKFNVSSHLIAATSTGWMGKSFVLPHKVINQPQDEIIVYQPAGLSNTARAIKQKGSLLDWQAGMKDASPMVKFGVCAALSAPVRYLVGIEAGGMHFFDLTSRGKTTLLQAAASVWGNGVDPAIAGGQEAYIQRWNATANALEAKAETFNDLPFIIDEIGEGDSREFGKTIYRVISGTGRGRSGRNGDLRDSKSWRVLIISAGELAVSDFIEQGGGQIKGGQLVRMVDLDLSVLPPLFTGSGDADVMKELCADNYGYAGPAMLEAIPDLTADWARMDLSDIGVAITPIAKRVRKRFALVAYTGAIASNAGIIPWSPSEILECVQQAYSAWHSGISTVSDIDRAVENIKNYILTNEVKFERAGLDEFTPANRVGWFRKNTYHFLPKVFKEACGGVDTEKVQRQLRKDGLLHTADGSRLTSRISIAGQKVRVISVRVEILGDFQK